MLRIAAISAADFASIIPPSRPCAFRPTFWHPNMPGHRLSARIREGRQNSRGRSHALPKAPKCRQAALNSRGFGASNWPFFWASAIFSLQKSVMSSLLIQAFCQSFVFSGRLLCCLRMEKYFRDALPSMLCIRPSIQAKQSASSNASAAAFQGLDLPDLPNSRWRWIGSARQAMLGIPLDLQTLKYRS